jgi:hypothetical protein
MFEDSESLNAFIESPLAEGVKTHPALSEFSVRTFDVTDALTAVIPGAVKVGATA